MLWKPINKHMFRLWLQINYVRLILSLKMSQECGDKRKHNLTDHQNHKNNRQNHKAKSRQKLDYPEEDNDSKKESNRASCSPASTKQWHQDPKNKEVH